MSRLRQNTHNDDWITSKTVAIMLGVEHKTVDTWRRRGKGPPYYSLENQVYLYKRDEVEDWIASRRVKNGSRDEKSDV